METNIIISKNLYLIWVQKIFFLLYTMIKFKDIEQISNLEILAKQLVDGFITGLHKSPYHGFSIEFSEHKPYNEWQSTRHIDWKVFARTDKLYSKQFEEDTNLRCLILIDSSSSMYYPVESKAKIKFSIQAAAAIAYLLHKQRDAVGLCLFSSKVEELTSIKSSFTHLKKLFSHLERKLEQSAFDKNITSIPNVLHEVAEKIHKRSLVILFSDLFDSSEDINEVFKSLQHLKHYNNEVLLFHISENSTEQEFNFDDRLHEFVDLENNAKIRLNPNEVRSEYATALKQFHQNIKLKCHQLKIDFIEVDTSKSYNEVLQAYLIKRAKMR